TKMRLFIFLFLLVSPFLLSDAVSVQCGLRIGRESHHRLPRMIIGGSLVNEGVWPWQVSLQKQNLSDGSLIWAGCGGTLIGSRWALTAAHCFMLPINREIERNFSVLIGSAHASVEEDTDIVRAVRRVIRHPKYDNDFFLWDIALLELEDGLPMDPPLIPICLPSTRQIIPIDVKAVVIGYGATYAPVGTMEEIRANLSTDKKLRQASLSLIPHQECYSHHGMQHKSLSLQGLLLCAGDAKHNTYRGDSGGPIMMKAADGRWFQIGISSIGGYKTVGVLKTTTPPSTTETVKRDEGSGVHSSIEGSGESENGTLALSSEHSEVEGIGASSVQRTEQETQKFDPKTHDYSANPSEKFIYEKGESSFTTVHKYCNWIEKTTKGEVKCPDEEMVFQEPPIYD
ncbi:hypothetical protein PENTCL1PPCAC_5713, partial [Pristionchus entomophagus]